MGVKQFDHKQCLYDHIQQLLQQDQIEGTAHL